MVSYRIALHDSYKQWQGKDFVDISHTNITDSLIVHERQFQISVKYWNLLSLNSHSWLFIHMPEPQIHCIQNADDP